MTRQARSLNAVSAELENLKHKKPGISSLGDGASLKRALDDAASAVR